MAKKGATKVAHPVRTLITLGLIIILMYSFVGYGVIQLHWNDISSKVTEIVTGQKKEDFSDLDQKATASDNADEPEDQNDNSAKDQKATASDNADEPDEPNASENASTASKVQDKVSFIPKFALDLAGGTEIILTPELEDGAVVDDNALDQAIDVIRQRIDASGVAESEINRQGQNNIVVGIPGETPSDDTIKLISHAAKMSFRPVLAVGGASSKFYSAAMGEKSALYTQTSQPNLDTEEEQNAFLDSINDQDKEAYKTLKKDDKATGTSKYKDIPNDSKDEFDALDCSKEENRKGGSNDNPKAYVATCAQDGSAKYLLAPVAVEGSGITHANSGLEPTQNGHYTNNWIVSLQFNEKADDDFINISQQIKVLDAPRKQFAITLDGLVISAPQIEKDTTFQKGNGVQISGGTDSSQQWANTLANQLSFGALPMSFKVDSTENVSASLGSEQLQKGLLAGLFGLLLVVLYSFYQYRALGLVTVGSLIVATALTYGVVLLMSWQVGYRLSLPGIIGFIVSIGVTADSFIVYFERIRDELRDNRTIDYAVTRGWTRAIRTIMASDFVNVLAAVVLYVLAVGGVRGFAFTLGLTTVIDFIVVCMFTHPMVILLSRVRFFAKGHPMSGLSSYLLGATEATQYRALTSSEKRALKANKLRDKREAREKALEAKKLKRLAKSNLQNTKKSAAIHKKAHELEMQKRSALLKAGVDENIALGDAGRLTYAERRAIAEGKDPKKLLKSLRVDDYIADTSSESDVNSDDTSTKATEVKKVATKKTDAKASKSATTKKDAAKASAVKTTTKKADTKASTAKKASTKTVAKATEVKKAATKSASTKTDAKKADTKASTAKKVATKSASTKTAAAKASTTKTATTKPKTSKVASTKKKPTTSKVSESKVANEQTNNEKETN